MRTALPLVLCMGVAACAQAPTGPSEADRQAAEAEVRRQIVRQFPDYPGVGPAANCVRDHATDEEILILAGQQGARTDRSLAALSFTIANREPARACLASNNVPPLG